MAAQEPTSPHGGNKSGLAMFTHKMKESLGLAEKTTSNEQVRDLAKKLDTLAEHLKMLMKGVQKSTSSLREMAEAGVELSNQMTDCSVMFAEDHERIFLSGSSSRTAEFERVMEDMRVKLATVLDVDIVAGLRSILESEIKDCRQQKAVYESSRVDLSNAQTKLATAQKSKQQPKIDSANAELDTMRKKFEQTERETLLRLQDGLSVSEYKMLDLLIRYVDTQKQFYNRGYQILNGSMVDVAEYRRHAEDTKRKLAARPQNPRRLTVRMSIAPKSSKKRFFGASIAELDADGRCIDGVPIFLLGVIVYIEQWGLEEEGIFRVASSSSQTDAIRAQVEANGGDYDWGVTGEKIFSATDLMKQFLRELPQTILPPEFTASAFAAKPSTEPSENIAALTTLLKRLPIGNQRILKLVFLMLNKISKVKANRMSPVALSTCLGPNLCTFNMGTDVDPFELTAQMNGLVSFIIQHAETIFQDVAVPVSPRGDAAPSSPRVAAAPAGAPAVAQPSSGALSSSGHVSPPTPASPRAAGAPVNGGIALPSLTSSNGSNKDSQNDTQMPPPSPKSLKTSQPSSPPLSPTAAPNSPGNAPAKPPAMTKPPPPMPSVPASSIVRATSSPLSNSSSSVAPANASGSNAPASLSAPKKVPPPISPRGPVPPTPAAEATPPKLPIPASGNPPPSRPLPSVSPNMVNPALNPKPAPTTEDEY